MLSTGRHEGEPHGRATKEPSYALHLRGDCAGRSGRARIAAFRHAAGSGRRDLPAASHDDGRPAGADQCDERHTSEKPPTTQHAIHGTTPSLGILPLQRECIGGLEKKEKRLLM